MNCNANKQVRPIRNVLFQIHFFSTIVCDLTRSGEKALTQHDTRFRKICIISFDFWRTVWQRHSCSIGCVWSLMEPQLASLSALALIEVQWVAFKLKLYSNSSSALTPVHSKK